MFVNRYGLYTFFIKVLCGLLLMLQGACAGKESFPELGDAFAGPIGVVAKDLTHFYVLNSDFQQNYDQGSIVVMDREGEKLTTIKINRLGVGLKVLDDSLIVYFSRGQTIDGKVEVYDISNPEQPVLQKTLALEKTCDPINLVAKEVGGQKIQSLSCINGDLYVGRLLGTESTLKKVRTYGFARRAMYIDAVQNALYAFPMIDQNKIIYIDSKRTDQKTFSAAEESDAPNEVPDDYESTLESLENLTDGSQYQMVVYDLAKAAADDYPLKTAAESQDELRWIYYELKDANGNFDVTKEANQNIYRTNFWEAIEHPTEADSFLLSQRNASSDNILKSNNVITVKVKLDPKADDEGNFSTTKDTFDFTRAYGFEGELPENANPGAIQVQNIDGKPILLVNHYRQQSIGSSSHSFSITAKEIGGPVELREIKGKAPDLSYYEIAMMSDGRTLSPSFYGNLVQLFDVPSSSDITSVSLTTIK